MYKTAYISVQKSLQGVDLFYFHWQNLSPYQGHKNLTAIVFFLIISICQNMDASSK